jgi:uncharacterized protein YndB with AHSA1/START domain
MKRDIAMISAAAFCLSSLTACQTVRQVSDPATWESDGQAVKERTDEALEYRVALTIEAEPERVWQALTDSAHYIELNDSLESFDGTIGKGQEVHLVPKADPDRTFHIKITEYEENNRMVWEDGMPLGLFSGVRTFTLIRTDAGHTIFAMSEVYSGGMLSMIEEDLPDLRPSFESMAANLKQRTEG